MLYTEADLEASMEKIEVINFHEEKEVGGVRFWAYNAGHVLGAAMFMIEIAGVKVLYTGDFSRQEDRHLMAAEIPTIRPDILITVFVQYRCPVVFLLSTIMFVSATGIDLRNAHSREAGGSGEPLHRSCARHCHPWWPLPHSSLRAWSSSRTTTHSRYVGALR